MAKKSKQAKNRKREKRGLSPLVEGIPVEEFIRRNADPVWLMQQGEFAILHEQSLAESENKGQYPVKREPSTPHLESNPSNSSSDDRRDWDEFFSCEWEQAMELGDDEDNCIPF